jgi:hypothetical protein
LPWRTRRPAGLSLVARAGAGCNTSAGRLQCLLRRILAA